MKKEIIENYIDKQGEGILGNDFIALTSIQARISISENKATKYIKELSESLGFKKHINTAWHIIKYVYPENPEYWKLQDKRNMKVIKKSAWIQANLKN